MAIYNKVELAALADVRMPTGVTSATSVTDIKNQLIDERDSADLYAGVISGDVDSISVTTTPQLLATFDTNVTSANELFETDAANDNISQLIPALVAFSFGMQAEWASNVDLHIAMKINDVDYPYFQAIQQGGLGPGKTVDMYKERIVPIGENAPFSLTFPAKIELWISGSSSTTVSQVHIEFGPKYEAYTIRTV